MSSETGLPTGAAARHPSVRRHGRKLAALVCWIALLGGYGLYSWRVGLTPPEAARHLVGFMATGAAGPLVYVSFYALSRLVLFPPTLLTIASGFVFGPVWGVVFAMLGCNAAASVSYFMGRYFGRGLLEPGGKSGVVRRYAEWMRGNGFESVLLMRLIYAPFDPVGILAGFLRIDWRRFALATVLGSLPCILSLVLVGASVQTGFTGDTSGFKPWVLLASVILFAGSLLISRRIKRGTAREKSAG